MKHILSSILIVLLFLGTPAQATNTPLQVVTSFSILADMARNIGGKAVMVTSLVGPDMDTHTYQPTPDDAKILANADLIIINGLGFEGWMQRLIEASGTKAKIVVASDGLQSRTIKSLKGVPDPHLWQNIQNGRFYVRNIAEAMEQAMPAEAKRIHLRATVYDKNLESLDHYVRVQLEKVPAAQRQVITSHDAFTYFGASYGITFMSPVGVSTESEPSATDVARLIKQIKTSGIKKLFIENVGNKKLIKQIAEDADADIGGTLYADSLSGEYGPASTYVAMFRNNVAELKEAMLLNKP